jgi:ubiquinone/menaquinone biosynthesis C-methylase UbiE
MNDWLKTVYSETSSLKLNKHYKKWSNSYDQDMKEWGYAYPVQLKKILNKNLKLKKGIKILDAGCGTGYVAEALIELKFKNIVGIYFYREILEIPKKKKIYSRLICQSLNETIKLRSNQFELVVCTGVLTSGHVGPNSIQELIRVVKPQGYFVCSIAESIFKKNGFKKEIENLTEIVKVTFISRQFIALPKNKNSAKSRMYILQKII